jgi:hypothetical protein
VRRDDLVDAAGVAAVLNAVTAEWCYTALTVHRMPAARPAFWQHLPSRSDLFVTEDEVFMEIYLEESGQ